MKVLIVPSWYPDSAADIGGSFFREQAISLSELGLDVTVADAGLMGRRRFFDKANRRVEELFDNNLRVIRRKSISFGRSKNKRWVLRRYEKNLGKILNRLEKKGEKFDVFHAHSFFAAGIAALNAAEKLNVPVVITEHASWVYNKWLTDFQAEKLKEAVLRADKFISVSKGLEESVKFYAGTSGKYTVLPNMVSSIFKPSFEKKDNKEFIFVSVGNLNKYKRPLFLLNAFKDAFSGDVSTKLIIIGDGPERGAAEEFVSRNGLGGQVTLLGACGRETVASKLRESDAFVLVSKYETFGVVYVEALASGLPVVATKNGGAESIVNESNGILVEVDDSDALVLALKNIRKNSAKYDKKALYEDAQAKFSGKTVAFELKKIYDEVVKRKTE